MDHERPHGAHQGVVEKVLREERGNPDNRIVCRRDRPPCLSGSSWLSFVRTGTGACPYAPRIETNCRGGPPWPPCAPLPSMVRLWPSFRQSIPTEEGGIARNPFSSRMIIPRLFISSSFARIDQKTRNKGKSNGFRLKAGMTNKTASSCSGQAPVPVRGLRACPDGNHTRKGQPRRAGQPLVGVVPTSAIPPLSNFSKSPIRRC